MNFKNFFTKKPDSLEKRLRKAFTLLGQMTYEVEEKLKANPNGISLLHIKNHEGQDGLAWYEGEKCISSVLLIDTDMVEPIFKFLDDESHGLNKVTMP